MTQIAYQTVGGVVKLLTKSGGLCTTCCADYCMPSVVSSVGVPPLQTLTYTGFFGKQAPIDNGYWRIYDAAGENTFASGQVVERIFVGLRSQYTNPYGDRATYFDFSVCCEGTDWIYIPHNNLYSISAIWQWFPPVPGPFITSEANASLGFEPVVRNYYDYWAIGCSLPESMPFYHIRVGSGSINQFGTFSGLATRYEIPSRRCNGALWYIYAYRFRL